MSKFQLSTDFKSPPDEGMWNQFRIWREGQFFLTDRTQLLDSSSRFTQEEIDKCTKYREFLASAPNNYKSVLDIPFYMYVTYFDYKMRIIDIDYMVEYVDDAWFEKERTKGLNTENITSNDSNNI